MNPRANYSYSYAGGDPINNIDCNGRCTSAQLANNLQNQITQPNPAYNGPTIGPAPSDSAQVFAGFFNGLSALASALAHPIQTAENILNPPLTEDPYPNTDAISKLQINLQNPYYRGQLYAGSSVAVVTGGLLSSGSAFISGLAPAAESAPLANVLKGHVPGQGFSGVYDASTGNVLIKPSTTNAVIPDGWVARAGGHADVSAALGGDAASHSGFAVILQEDGSLGITWTSRTLNPAPNFTVPPSLQSTIIDSVQSATGRTVNP